MKTARLRFITSSLLLLVILLNLICPASAVVTSNDGYGSSKHAYKGPYKLSSSHRVGLYYRNPTALDSLRSDIYKELISWGMTPEAAAGVLGNIVCESAGDPTRMQNDVSWGSFKWGITGIGLIQWTYWSLQANLFNNAAKMGKPWTDLEVQFKAMKDYFGPGSGASYLYNDMNLTSYEIACKFLVDYEKPAVFNYKTRGSTAVSMYNKYSGLPPEDLSHVNLEDGSRNDTNDGTTPTEGEDSSQENSNNNPSFSVLNEWDIEGMPERSGITPSSVNVKLPDALSDYNDTSNIANIGQNIATRNEFDAWKFARCVLVFTGMMVFVYALLLILSVLFDNVNNFIDLSMVSLFTFGTLRYVRDKEGSQGVCGYVSTSRMVVIITVLMITGLFFISGGVFSFILKAVYWVLSLLN